MSTQQPPPAEPAAVPGPAVAETPVAIDPICKMKVNPAAPKGGSFAWEGTTYYFCNPKCREKFAADPERYLAAPPTRAQPPAGSCSADTPIRSSTRCCC